MPRRVTCSSSWRPIPARKSDVPSWAEISGNELLESDEPTPGQYRYLVRKA